MNDQKLNSRQIYYVQTSNKNAWPFFIAASSSKGRIDPEKDIYAIPSRSTENREIYFLALVDILTHYGMKKQAAKVAKTGLAT